MRVRTITVTERYLMLPVADSQGWFLAPGVKQYLRIYVHGKLLLELETALSDAPRANLPLDMAHYTGQKLTCELEGGNEQLLDALYMQSEYDVQSAALSEPLRPIYHFTPLGGFMNDPNGLMQIGNTYHLFAQSNPAGFGVGNTHWLHAISRDMLYWRYLPCALMPDESGRMYSGGGVVDVNNTSGLGRGKTHPPVFLFYTAAGSKSRLSRGKPFEIAAAYSLDDGMTFTKFAEPLIRHASFMNRDPKVEWVEEENCWFMVVYLDNDIYRLYRSDNLLDWSFVQDQRIDHAAECPDIFRIYLDGRTDQPRWVLWGSPDCYLIGRFSNGHFIPDGPAIDGPVHQKYDPYGILARSPGGYAAQTFTGLNDGRIVQLAWIRSSQHAGSFVSCMSVPMEMRLITTSCGERLSLKPIEELSTLYDKEFTFTGGGIEELSHIPPQCLSEAMDISMSMTLASGRLIALTIRGVLLVYNPDTQRLILPWGAYKLMPINGELKLRILVDRCSMELFSDDGVFHLSAAISPDPSDTAIRAVDIDPATGIDFSVHTLKNIWIRSDQ